MPFVADSAVWVWRDHAPRAWRALAAAVLGTLFIAPAAYGAATLLQKALGRRQDATMLRSADGLRLDLLHARPAPFYRELAALVPEPDAVFYVTTPELALPLAARRFIIRHADFTDLSELGRERFRGCTKGPLAALLPRPFERSGRSAAIMRSFVDVSAWRAVDLRSAPHFRLWLATPRCAGIPGASASGVR